MKIQRREWSLLLKLICHYRIKFICWQKNYFYCQRDLQSAFYFRDSYTFLLEIVLLRTDLWGIFFWFNWVFQTYKVQWTCCLLIQLLLFLIFDLPENWKSQTQKNLATGNSSRIWIFHVLDLLIFYRKMIFSRDSRDPSLLE